MPQVALVRVVPPDDPPDAAPRGPGAILTQDDGLDLVLDLGGQLVAGRTEQLDAVVLHGVVRRGDHGPGLGTEVRGQERDARGRADAEEHGVPAR